MTTPPSVERPWKFRCASPEDTYDDKWQNVFQVHEAQSEVCDTFPPGIGDLIYDFLYYKSYFRKIEF